MIKLFALFLCLSVLAACSDRNSPQGLFDNYLYRLHNSLEIDSKRQTLKSSFNEAAAQLPRYPKRTDLRYPIRESTINLIEFLRLSQCDLQRHIGERNSSLGKLQKDSQRFIYDIAFIHLADICIESLATDNPLKSVLQTARVDKQDQLFDLLWNASFASEEFAHLFSLSTGFISAERPAQKPNTLYESLAVLARASNEAEQLQRLEQSKLESSLSVIASRKYMGEIRRSMLLVREGLAAADDFLKQRIEGKALCRQATPNKQFDIVNNVFRKFYIGEVQPYIATVFQQAEASLQLLDTMFASKSLPNDYQQFWQALYRGENSEWLLFKNSIQIHTENWQQLLKQCGSLPGA